jgi:hypothetical protein
LPRASPLPVLRAELRNLSFSQIACGSIAHLIVKAVGSNACVQRDKHCDFLQRQNASIWPIIVSLLETTTLVLEEPRM